MVIPVQDEHRETGLGVPRQNFLWRNPKREKATMNVLYKTSFLVIKINKHAVTVLNGVLFSRIVTISIDPGGNATGVH